MIYVAHDVLPNPWDSIADYWSDEVRALSDDAGPVTTDVLADPNPAAVGTDIFLAAPVDDSGTGDATIDADEYTIEGEPRVDIEAEDGAFDQVSEAVSATLPAYHEAGVHNICVSGTDAAGHAGEAGCTFPAVYDPDGGFVSKY